jgi:glycosyltransferase involved in cell wall biosynthesis
VLFQYHPHAEFESRLLAEDKRRFPDIGESFSGASGRNGREALPPRDHDVWRHADLILCASAFTRRSLEEVGCDPKKCRIVPYGIEMPRQPVVANLPPESFQVVFVGSGGQRKGLHHLLLAWKGAKLPKSSRLTLVCRAIDRGIEKMLPEIPRVTLSGGMTQTELDRLYAGATLFAMPSLVEGFGQVYLEAMAHGCPVLGTRNTGLPELGGEADGVFTVEPGDIDALVDKLERLSEALSGDKGIRRRTAARAARFSWPAFRNGVRDALTSSASQTRAT